MSLPYCHSDLCSPDSINDFRSYVSFNGFSLLYVVVSQQFDNHLYMTDCLNTHNHNTCIHWHTPIITTTSKTKSYLLTWRKWSSCPQPSFQVRDLHDLLSHFCMHELLCISAFFLDIFLCMRIQTHNEGEKLKSERETTKFKRSVESNTLQRRKESVAVSWVEWNIDQLQSYPASTFQCWKIRLWLQSQRLVY